MADEFNDLFTKAETFFKGFIGKPGHNPFFKLEELLQAKSLLEKGEKDKALEKVKAIKLVPPLIATPVIPILHKREVPEESKPEQAIPTQKVGVDIQTPTVIEPPKKSTPTIPQTVKK